MNSLGVSPTMATPNCITFTPNFGGYFPPFMPGLPIPQFDGYGTMAAAFASITGLNVLSQQNANAFGGGISLTPIYLRDLFYWNSQALPADQVFYIPDSEYQPFFDCDFTHIGHNPYCTRGDYPYTRPTGWYRKAVNVVGKYENDVWLGQGGWRDRSSPGEWPVSYHGTRRENVNGIVVNGYDPNMNVRQLYGPGIYSTPDPKVAEKFATEFIYNGEKYKCILQNRVNRPNTKRIFHPVTNTYCTTYFVTLDKHDIRPYGVCIKKIYS